MATPTAPRPAGPVTPRIPARSPLLAALLSIATLWLGGLAACARMEPPPGGPEDKVRPYVAMVYPGPGATGVSRELKARIAFSEWVNPDAARKVHLSPPPARRLKVEVKGNLLEVTSPAPLDSGTTYVLGVSGTVLDLHGLPLEAPFQLMFSTGATLDSGALAGRISVFPGARPPAGTVAALYPEDPVLRARFSHLGRRVPRPDLSATPSVSSDSQALSALPPVAFRERPAYLAPADSLGAFAFQGVRPGRYLTLAFQDANQDGEPDPGSEPLALGPATTVSAAAGPPASLALAPYDTLPMRLLAARWTHEAAVSGLSHGSLRLSFSRPPHPRRALRRELYSVRRAGATGGAPVLDVAFDPETGEVDLYTSPLKPDTAWRVSLGPVSDLLGNTLDTSRDEATFAVAFPDTARSAAPPAASAASTAGAGSEMGPIFLGSIEASGTRKKLPREAVFPGRGLVARMPRILTDSLLKALSVGLEARIDTVAVPLFLSRVNHHELSLRFGPIPLRGQILTIGPKAAPAPA
ncbi:MAG TPA: Ig-like domain-containing protein, partial [Fibrobacteria bacterium]|nr:Ig-like domain-containing protein [Fibrobacteria bacterium]